MAMPERPLLTTEMQSSSSLMISKTIISQNTLETRLYLIRTQHSTTIIHMVLILVRTWISKPPQLLCAAEVDSPSCDGAEHGCGVCEDAEAAGLAAASAGFLAKRMRRDPRLQVLWVRGGLVAFRMLGWFDTSAETLNTELLNETNSSTSGSARTWIAPTRGELCGDEQAGQLTLLHASGPHTRPALCWADLQAAAERVMTRHLSGFVCGSCDCLENLAGQVLV